ncbi:MAG: hypothetical protein RI883_2240 [Bacteroidota bacterium]
MSWTDEEMDKLFGEAADKQVFEYRSEYWNYIEKQLPIQKQVKRAYWWWTANVFLLGFIGLIAFDSNKESNVVNQIKNTTALNPISDLSADITKLKTNKKDVFRELATGPQVVTGVKANNTNSQNIDLNSFDKINNLTPIKTEKRNVITTKIEDEEILIIHEKQVVIPAVLSAISTQIISENLDKEFELTKVKQEDFTQNEKLILNSKELTFVQIDAQLETVSFQNRKNQLMKMYVELYGGLGQSYIKNATDANAVNATIGGVVGLSFPVNRFNVSAGLGLQATKFDQLNILERTKVYGFGSQTLENSYEFSSIYSLLIPLSASYVYGRHSLNFGLTTNINLVTQLKHSQTLDGNFKSYSSGCADVSFFNRFGLAPTLGYSFNVNEKTQIGVRLNLQLLQQLQSNRFIGAPSNMPVDGQIYLRRTLDL